MIVMIVNRVHLICICSQCILFHFIRKQCDTIIMSAFVGEKKGSKEVSGKGNPSCVVTM